MAQPPQRPPTGEAHRAVKLATAAAGQKPALAPKAVDINKFIGELKPEKHPDLPYCHEDGGIATYYSQRSNYQLKDFAATIFETKAQNTRFQTAGENTMLLMPAGEGILPEGWGGARLFMQDKQGQLQSAHLLWEIPNGAVRTFALNADSGYISEEETQLPIPLFHASKALVTHTTLGIIWKEMGADAQNSVKMPDAKDIYGTVGGARGVTTEPLYAVPEGQASAAAADTLSLASSEDEESEFEDWDAGKARHHFSTLPDSPDSLAVSRTQFEQEFAAISEAFFSDAGSHSAILVKEENGNFTLFYPSQEASEAKFQSVVIKPAKNGFVANDKTYPTLKEAIILLARERNIDIAVIKPATYDNPADLDEDIYTVSGSSTDLAYKKYYTAPDGAAEADRAAGSPTATGIDLQALKTKALKENLEEKEISQLILFVGLGAKDEGLPKALAKYKKLSAPEQKLLIMAIANGVTFDEAVSTIQTAKFESQAKAASRLTATGADEEPIVIASLIASNAKQGFQSGELKALAKLYHTSFNGDFLVSFKTTVMVLKKPNDFVKWVLKAPSPTTEDLEQDVATFKEESRTGSKGLLKFGGRKGGSPTGSDASSSEGGSVASGEGSTPSMASRLIGVFRRKPTGSQEELRSTGAASAASGGSAVNADGDEIYGTVPTANFPDENIVRGDNKKLVASLKPGEYFIGVSASTLKTTMYYCNSQGTAKYDEFTMPLTQEQVNAIASGRSVSNLMIPDGAGELKPNPPSRL